MTAGQKVIAAALATEGVHEDPMASNRGPDIDVWQREAEQALGLPLGTYRAAPWCAIWVMAIYRDAGVEVPVRLVHPFTGFICQEADRLGGLAPAGDAPPGALMVRCGVHVGLVVRDRGDGLLDTIEGNADHAVRRLVRARADWRIIVPPGIEDDPTPAITSRASYGFDDLGLKPDLYGGWKSEQARDRALARFVRANPAMWAVPVRIARSSPFAFRAGPQGTLGATWRFGGWPSAEVRDEQLQRYATRANLHRLRTWRREVAVPFNGEDLAGAPSAGVTTT